MSKINFIAIGGVQENGKNLYAIEVDERIFVLDCGLKYPTSELYGVDVIVNDLSYLVENIDTGVKYSTIQAAFDACPANETCNLKQIYDAMLSTKHTVAANKIINYNINNFTLFKNLIN